MTLNLLARKLRGLQRREKWSWERMCREMHRVMENEGPAHTTLFRYATLRVRKPNVCTRHWIEKAVERLNGIR